MRRKLLVFLLWFNVCGVMLVYPETMALAQTESKCQECVQQFYSLYEDYVKQNDIKNAEEITNSVRHLFETLNDREKEEIIDALIEDTTNSFDENDNSKFLFAAQRALYIIPIEEPARFDILLGMAEIYEGQGNKELLQATINQMKNTTIGYDPENFLIMQQLQA